VASAAQAAVQALQAVQAAMAAASAAQASAASSGAGGGGGTPPPISSFRGGYQYFDKGGSVGQDTVDAKLSPGEFVVNQSGASKFFSELNAVNSGATPQVRDTGGSVTNVGDIHLAVDGMGDAQHAIQEIGNALRREIKRGLLKF
jgi:hypothetical protein